MNADTPASAVEPTPADQTANPALGPSAASTPTSAPLADLSLPIPAEWLAQLESITTKTRRPLVEVGREAIARYLAITITEAAEIERLRSELSALKTQLTRLDAIDAVLARLSRRQDTLERSPLQQQHPAVSTASSTQPNASPPIEEKSDEDWGLFDDEPDEVLTDFLQ